MTSFYFFGARIMSNTPQFYLLKPLLYRQPRTESKIMKKVKSTVARNLFLLPKRRKKNISFKNCQMQYITKFKKKRVLKNKKLKIAQW